LKEVKREEYSARFFVFNGTVSQSGPQTVQRRNAEKSEALKKQEGVLS